MKHSSLIILNIFFIISCSNESKNKEIERQDHHIVQDQNSGSVVDYTEEFSSTLPQIQDFNDCYQDNAEPLTLCEWKNIPDMIVYGKIKDIKLISSPSVLNQDLLEECNGYVDPSLEIKLENINFIQNNNIIIGDELTFYIGRDQISLWSTLPSYSENQELIWRGQSNIKMNVGDMLGATLFTYHEKYSPLGMPLFQIINDNGQDKILFQSKVKDDCNFLSNKNINHQNLSAIQLLDTCDNHYIEQIRNTILSIYGNPAYAYAARCLGRETPPQNSQFNCQRNDECGGFGYLCYQGDCIYGCVDSSQCPNGFPCINGTCIQCAENETERDCQERHYCTNGICDIECFNDSDCEQGHLCVTGLCLKCESRGSCQAP